MSIPNNIKVEQLLESKEGYTLKKPATYYSYLEDDFEPLLERFLDKFENIRQEKGAWIEDRSIMLGLPHTLTGKYSSWQWRVMSLNIINEQLEQSPGGRILEIGGWNGWLSRHLRRFSDQVVTVDYFTHQYDGLGAIEIDDKITVIQMDNAFVPELFKSETFDVVIVNHALQFMPNPVQYTNDLKRLLRCDGQIISVGDTVYTDATRRAEQFRTDCEKFRIEHGFEMMIHPAKGYLDANDMRLMEEMGFKFKPYQGKWVNNALARFIKTRPTYFSIHYQRK